MSLKLRSHLMYMVAIVLGIYAIIWGLAPFTSINISARFLLDVLDWPLDSMPNILDTNTKWLSAIGAGLLGCVAVFLGGIVAPAIAEGDTRVARVTIVAIMVWYIIDGVGSFAVGIPSNVAFNTLYLVFMIFPMIGMKSAQ